MSNSLPKQLYDLISPYWKSEEKVFAWVMLIGVLTLNMAIIYVMVLLNDWNGSFYNALQTLDKTHFTGLLLRFFAIVMVAIAISVTASFAESYLAFRWRMWLTKQVMGDWLHNSTFCRLFTYKTKTENPDQRISQDLSSFTTDSLSLSLNIVTQTARSVTFVFILWKLAGHLPLPLPNGGTINIPGYIIWITLIYVTFSTYVIYKAGRPLVALGYNQEKVEADFRFSLMRIRERRDEVSILDGAKAETRFLNNNLAAIIKNFRQIIIRNIYVNSFQNLSSNLTTILPYLAAAPMLFAGAITLGVLMQIANAFNQVEGALMIFAVNFQSFASWKATFNRITDFRTEMTALGPKLVVQNENLTLLHDENIQTLKIDNLILRLPQGQNLAKFNFDIKPHERVLLMGRSGLGKSTLLKCIAGHWPYASGAISRPEHVTIIPQKPYFPIGTLHDSLLYPNLDLPVSKAEIKRVLQECSLENLQDRIFDVSDWNAILSPGEQQRLNFVRIILAKPDWIILDEPTASMDRPLETKLFTTLFNELPNMTLLTIGHSPSLKDLHTRCIEC